ncbi:MAG: TetR/AcrR family transcriptional regulator [Pseudomonadota bacterium]
MAGVRKFDDQVVLEQCLHAFWSKGYDSVSIPELEKISGVGRQSLYLAFGDKKTLFLRALQHYADQYIGAAVSKLRLSEPLEGINGLFDILFERMSNADNPRGCLVTNATLEAGAGDADIKSRVELYFRELASAIQDCVERGQKQSVFTPNSTSEELSLSLLALTRGLSVMHRAGFSIGELQQVRKLAMSQLVA